MHHETSRDAAGISPAPAPELAGDWSGGRASERARRASMARKTSGRRRLVDPTTSDRDYSPEELEFMRAMQQYKHRSGRMFPTWSEVLEVLRDLGYEKPEPVGALPAVEPGPTARPDLGRPIARG